MPSHALNDVVKMRLAVEDICAAIDRGELKVTEPEMLALATVVQRMIGPAKSFDLLVMLASRCDIGRKALREIAH